MDLVLRPATRSTSHPSGVWFPLDHAYLERCWPSLIGPSGVLFLRRAAALFQAHPEVTISIVDLALDLGVGSGDRSAGSSGRVHRTIGRLARLGFVRLAGPVDVDVFTDVPPLPAAHLRRVSPLLRRDHDRLIAARSLDLHTAAGSAR